MYHDFNYEATLASSLRAQWQLDDVLREPTRSSISRATSCPRAWPARPRSTALNPFEQRILNQISAHQYLSIFGIVEEFILPFLLDHARPHLLDDDWRVRAHPQFRERGSQAHPSVQALPRRVRPRLPGRMPGDRPVRSDRRGGAPPRSARGRPRDPDDRVDDPGSIISARSATTATSIRCSRA